ncbi:alpha-galactosidase [bacterium]|nr:alpha-galactosidase [bacterium]
MTTAWRLELEALSCRVEWRDHQLWWQFVHPSAPGGQTHLTPISAVSVDHRPVAWTTLVDAQTTVQPTPQLAVTVEDSSGRLRLTRHFELFGGHAFARTWGIIERIGGGEDPLIDNAAILNLSIDAGRGATLFHVEQFSWPYNKDFFRHRQIPLFGNLAPYELRMGSFPAHYLAPTSCAWFSLREGWHDESDESPGVGAGVVVGIEFNGKSRLHAWSNAQDAIVENCIDDLRHPLKHGEPFEVPAFFIGCYHGDWDEAGFVTQRFAEDNVHPPMPDDRYPWVQYNSWGYGQEIDEAQQMAILERCAELGIEVAILDLGWARTIGDWRPNPAKFPRGLRPLSDRAHELGMKFGVHVAIAQMAADAPAAHEHPEWLVFTGDDYFGAGAICLGHDPCREWLIDSLNRLIEENGIDYIIQDGEDVVKRCTRDDHTHAPGNSNYACSTQGLDQVILAVRKANPHLVWENCEDGGCMLTYRMARLCHTSITVDNIAAYATRQGVYGASYAFSPRYSVRYMQDDPTPYTLRSSIFGGPLILMHRVGNWNAQQVADTKAAIGQYKELRTLVRESKIIHLVPPTRNVDHFGRDWDAIQAVSLDQSRAVVMVYRALGGEDERTIRLRGLRAGTSYAVRHVDSGQVSVRSAESLHNEGVTLALTELGSEMIKLEMVSG